MNTGAYRFSRRLQRLISSIVVRTPIRYLIDPQTGLIYPMHFLAALIAMVLFVFWIAFDWAAYPGAPWGGIQSAPVVYVYASLLLFVWVFAFLNYHLGRLRISSLAALLIFVLIGYWFFGIDHSYWVTRDKSELTCLTPVDTAENSGDNLVVIASEGGGIWAAGWTALALEKLIAARPELAHEIRVLSTVSGASVAAAYFIQGLLNDKKYAKEGTLNTETLQQVRVKATSSSLEAVAYGVAFRDFPRLVTGGAYHPTLDRGYLLEDEWARIAAGKVAEDNEHLSSKGDEGDGQCWGELTKCSFLHLREFIRRKSGPDSPYAAPAVIFNSTVMEAGRRIMITPLDFEERAKHARAQTLSDFLFKDQILKCSDDNHTATLSRANLPLWTAARLSATFSFVSPAVQSSVIENGQRRSVWQRVTAWLASLVGKYSGSIEWREHLVDAGYYDNFGVASALDWLQPVMEARRKGDSKNLNFSRVLSFSSEDLPIKKLSRLSERTRL